ncbi:MAG: DUF4105 domain-containing protein [Spirochaetaceae bacterium]|jgi:hypothetical protein|nr:DUF4105 domain-containing protein [Spirochaetaceae bacterium]
MNRNASCIFFAIVLVLAVSDGTFAEEKKNRGDYLTVQIAVIGPGDELYFWWGHLGLIIEDKLSGTSKFYDYGVFSFDNENFFLNFAFGRLLYTSTVSDTRDILRRYIETNRDIAIYTLNLNARQKEAVMRAAERNILPEYRDYLYNHFSDNCVTRTTNLLDDALDGQFYAMAKSTPGRLTLREHVRRHTYFSPFWDWLLNFLMGQGIDAPSTVKEELFLPSEVGRVLQTFYYIDANGAKEPLLSSVEILNTSKGRPPVLDAPRARWPYGLCYGAAVSLVLLMLMLLSKKLPAGRVLLGLSQSLLGLFFGLAGTVAGFMTFFTNHDYTWHNINVLFVNPLLLAAVPLGLKSAFGKNENGRALSEKILKGLWTYVFSGGVLTMLIKLSPAFYQQNQVTLALVLPFAFTLSFIPVWIGKIPHNPHPSGKRNPEG